MQSERRAEALKRFLIAVVFAVAFAYIESAVVVYLREIFYAEGFSFPLPNLLHLDPAHRYVLMTEIGREASTLIVILTAAWLFGRNRAQRFAYFMAIFAIWDIFYYVWLKAILGWPESIMDWDILFLIPVTWASAVLYPVIVSVIMLAFAAAILYRDAVGRLLVMTAFDRLLLACAAAIIVVSFCTAGPYITADDYKAHFYWPLFAAGAALAMAVLLKCLARPRRPLRGAPRR